MRLLRRLAPAAAAIAVLAVAALSFTAWRTVPPLNGRERLPALGAAVEVRFDRHGIPHITAASTRDAFTALGYLHARDRLFAMELMRRAAEGRLSELMGPATVETDAYLRSLDMRRGAQSALSAASAETRELLAAYVAGVNRWITARPRPLPVEFQVLRGRPEPWTVETPFLVARLMSWDLVSATLELRLARAVARVGAARASELLPGYPADAPVILDEREATWGGGQRIEDRGSQRSSHFTLPSSLLAEGEVPEIPPQAAALLEMTQLSRASNSFVVGPARSRSGRPILANDPHLGLRAPALWYLVAIESPDLVVAGGSIPGLPGVVIGRNRRIAWGLTNIGVDDVDYVIERLSDDSSRVLTAQGWRPIEVMRDSIRVKGAPAVPFTLRRTPHGPLLAMEVPGARPDSGEARAYAMRWNGHDPSDELGALLAVMRAGSWDRFTAALAGWRSPEQNWIYADVDGNIGYAASGAVPVRRRGEGLLPTPGWTDEGRWDRYLDAAELPRVLNPREGFIVTANNRVIGDRYPHLITRDWELPHRAARIRELVVAGPFTAADLARFQLDSVDVFARATRGLAAAAASAAGRDDLARLLTDWDGGTGTDRREPLLFYAWYRALLRETFDDELGGVFISSDRLQAWLRAGASPWFDDIRTPGTEDLAALSERAMRTAIAAAGEGTWGGAHHTISRHALGSVRALDLLRLNVGPLPRAGSPYTVNVAGFSEFAPPFTNTHAASLRMVVDLGDPEAGALVTTTGQSGNPLSGRYRDQAPLWLQGRLVAVPLSGDRVTVAGRLRLEP